MLAKRYSSHSSHTPFPCFVQPKINGFRALYNNQAFQSRGEELWAHRVTQHLSFHLSHIPPHIILDGEFYRHGFSLQQINSAVSVNRAEPTARTPEIQYHVFDLLDATRPSLSFSDRSQLLHELIPKDLSDIIPVETHLVHSTLEADSLYSQFRKSGYEGMMYRSDSPYGLTHNCGNKENRWTCLLKRKEHMDWEGVISDVVESTINPGTIGSLQFIYDNGVPFTAGSGLSHFQKLDYVINPPIGKRARLIYEMLSDSGTPLQPRIECVLD